MISICGAKSRRIPIDDGNSAFEGTLAGMVRNGSPSDARSESSGAAAKEQKRVQDAGRLALDRSAPAGAGIDFLGGR